jgi:hypothetical protein
LNGSSVLLETIFQACHPLRAALHRVDQEIQHMLENARRLAKAA